MAEPRVSIGVPTYRGTAFLTAIDSVLRQSHRTFEVRVIENNLSILVGYVAKVYLETKRRLRYFIEKRI